ncbi:MAG: winged helix-turn-helix transcriptional regulator [Desulfobacterales bacterium]|nr:winged helix-turn-helix transcriptional regulator [Desulfobacterales bacterium]
MRRSDNETTPNAEAGPFCEIVDNESMNTDGKRSAPTAAPPVAAMVEDIVGCKWSMRLLELVAGGSSRPGAMLRACSGLSAKVMNERLHKMIRFGIAKRNVIGEKPPLEVRYTLTAFGFRFKRVIDEVRRLQEALDHETDLENEIKNDRPKCGPANQNDI